MVEFDAFRQDLAASLLHCAERRRLCGGGAAATGEDIKIIALLERLADDAENLGVQIFLIFELLFADKRLARRFLRQHEDLLAQLGVLYCPSSANDLVRWLAGHAKETIPDDSPPRSPMAPATAILSPPRQPR